MNKFQCSFPMYCYLISVSTPLWYNSERVQARGCNTYTFTHEFIDSSSARKYHVSLFVNHNKYNYVKGVITVEKLFISGSGRWRWRKESSDFFQQSSATCKRNACQVTIHYHNGVLSYRVSPIEALFFSEMPLGLQRHQCSYSV